MYGPEKLREELTALGYAVEILIGGKTPFVIISGYEVPVGQFMGKQIDLGIPATPDFPRTVGSSIHVKAAPQLFDYTDSVPGKRNIVESPLGPEWRYWSHNFGWNGSEKSARFLMNQIKGIFAHA